MKPEDLGFGKGSRTETRAEDRTGCDVCGRGPCRNQCGLELGGPYEGDTMAKQSWWRIVLDAIRTGGVSLRKPKDPQ